MEKVEKVIELDGKFYCRHFGVICEKNEIENSIGYIEAMEDEVGTDNYQILEKEL